MTVYVEYVIIDNMSMTYLICRLSQRLAGVRTGRLRPLLASVLGTGAALLYPLIESAAWTVVLRVVLWISLALIIFPIRKLIKGAIGFLLITFTFGGVFFAVGYLVYGDAVKALSLPPFEFPIGIIPIGGWGIYALVKKIIKRIKSRTDIEEFVYGLKVRVGDKQIDCNCFMDTGNRLTDETTGLPVIMLSLDESLKLLNDEDRIRFLTGQVVRGGRYSYYSGAGSGKSKMLLIKPDSLVVYNADKENILYDVMVGMSKTEFKNVEGCGAVISPAVIKEYKRCA